MASIDETETLETLLNKATSPMNRDEDWEYIMNFCDRVNVELEGPEIACRLLSHKIQSPQEREALQALTVVEACVKNCGEPFHKQVGKFRFLNEMIKLVSPKYLGTKSPESVKKKVIEMMYSWQAGLPQEPKIIEAYQMLKKQGLVKEDPVYMDKQYLPPPPPRPKNAAFEDEEKSKLLARLLKSKHPEDLQAANRLIKNMVKEDEKKTEKLSRRMNELESCNNNVKLLTEMMEHYQPGVTSEQEMELMKELYIACEKMRPNLFRLASDTEDKDDGIADVLQTNDAVVKVMEMYKEKIGLDSLDQPSSPSPVNSVPSAPLAKTSNQEDSLLDLSGLDPAPPAVNNASDSLAAFAPYSPPSSPRVAAGVAPTTQPSSTQLLQDQLSSLGFPNSTTGQPLAQSTQGFTRTSVTQRTSPIALESMLGPVPTSGMPNYSIQQQQAGPSVFDLKQPSNPLQPRMGAPVMAAPTAAGAASMVVRPNQPIGTMGGTIQPAGIHPTTNQPAVRLPPYNRTHSAGGAVLPQGGGGSGMAHSPFADLESLGKSMVKQQMNGVKQPSVSTQQPVTTPQPAGQQQPQPAGPQLSSLTPPTQQALTTTQSITQPMTSPPAQSPAQPILPTQTTALPAPTQSTVQGTSQPTVQGTVPPVVATSPPATVLSLADVFVPLETVQPGTIPPITAYEKNFMKTVFHFAKNAPRADITVLVVSTMSTNPSAVKNVVFQAAVPKTMRVKLQPPSATDLPAFNPILPPAAITQVMLIANPQKEKVRLKFKIQYTIDDQVTTDVGEVEKFPV
ncbi:ADP-ribosylation factor-binding protein GGA1-like [Acanthaster planci]|uniref:ADP-ribosylation factor-binding protein GGA1-like n=1 Tax=Acanthaster planci TaxID=133434 RepID=A0A8B7XK54_ACAPL|nr:ADP-ribosylation factor-binding protein GGA1-like [Acanthaster planci]